MSVFSPSLKHRIWRCWLTVLAARERFVRPTSSVLLLMAHMRSGSTLLLHLLASHPSVSACGERNASYRSSFDFDRLVAEVRFRERRSVPTATRYFLDQINHHRFLSRSELLAVERVRTVFLVRAPRASIESHVRLLRSAPRAPTTADATDYYVGRLASLERHGRWLVEHGLEGHALLVTYEDLIGRGEACLARLQRFLDLEEPLRSEYNLQPFTRRRGDTGPRILLGRVSAPPHRPALDLSDEDLDRATAAHISCLSALAPLAV